MSAMKKGERAVLTVAGCEEPQLGLKSSEKVRGGMCLGELGTIGKRFGVQEVL